MNKKVETKPAPYNRKRIAWELERTAMGDGYYGSALYAAKELPEATPAVRSLLDRWATGKESGLSDRTNLCAFALQIYAADEESPSAPAASDGGFTAADMMDARQDGRKEAQHPAAVSLTGVELAQGPDDIPRLLLDGREVATFPAGSWPEVCEAFDFGGYRKEQPAAVDGAMVERAWEAAMEIKHNKEPWFPMTKRRMKRALTAALADQPGGSDNDR